jgi:hypothetical protein
MAHRTERPMTDDELPKGHARLVLSEDDVTHVIQGPEESVEQRLWQEVADDVGMTVEEMEQVDDYPMPDPDEGLVPADEFHDSGE